jgi:hypothetical protein
VTEAGLDSEKLGLLQRWANGLQEDPREEVAAAGRAILLLIEEIERLHVVVWDMRLYPGAAPQEPEAPADGDVVLAPPEELPLSLAQRLQRRLRARDESPSATSSE